MNLALDGLVEHDSRDAICCTGILFSSSLAARALLTVQVLERLAPLGWPCHRVAVLLVDEMIESPLRHAEVGLLLSW